MKVHELVARCAKARETADPLKSMRALLDELSGDVSAIEAAARGMSGGDGTSTFSGKIGGDDSASAGNPA